jgi:hypothetical protein
MKIQVISYTGIGSVIMMLIGVLVPPGGYRITHNI